MEMFPSIVISNVNFRVIHQLFPSVAADDRHCEDGQYLAVYQKMAWEFEIQHASAPSH